MRRDYDVLIVGAGLTGLMAAALLATGAHSEKLRVVVVDAAERPQWRPGSDLGLRVSAVSMGSAELLASIGAWEFVASGGPCAYDHMRVWDEDAVADGPTALRFDADEFAVPHLGYIVENLLLRQALLAVLDRTAVQFLFGVTLDVLEVHAGRQRASFDGGEQFDADIVIAADGARSAVRALAGIGASGRAYEQTALVTHLRPEKPHAATAWQRFLRDGPIGLLPLADGRVSTVWSTTPETVAGALDLDDAELSALLTDVSGGVLGRLCVAAPRAAFPLAAQHAHSYVRHGIALLGDAAHTVHPLAGQGANLGLADARALADVIQQAIANGEYPGDRPVLRRYERARKGENLAMMHCMTGLNRLFASDSAVLGELRKTGMALFNYSGPIRRRVVDIALGGRHT